MSMHPGEFTPARRPRATWPKNPLHWPGRMLEIFWMKRQARIHARQILDMFDAYDCGAELIDHITGGRLSRAKAAFETAMDRLEEIDPNFPHPRREG